MTISALFKFECDFCTLVTQVDTPLNVDLPISVNLPPGWRAVAVVLAGSEGPHSLICPGHSDSSFEPKEVLR